VIRYPTIGASADRHDGPYPLIVFSQGYDLAAETYAPLLTAWAEHGYVVADPTYPKTDPSAPGGLDENDIVHHPADLSFVITQLLAMSGRPGSPLSAMIRPAAVGVAGHSDGGDVALAVAADSCCRDQRVRAAAVLSGAELASFGGSYFQGGSAPLLAAQGSSDVVNLPACSTQLYDAAPPPKYYLDLIGQSHRGPYLGTDRAVAVVTRVTTDFFDLTLKHDPSAAARMRLDGTEPDVASLTSGSAVPEPAGSCPGA
jgi:predicted dienelactone hydrolase